MPAGRLLIGPLLRRVVGTRATVWVETSAPAVVTVRAANGASGTAPTFSAYHHHYALVVVDGLTPDSAASYQVLIDDEMAWPVLESGFPPSMIRTRATDDRDQPVKLIFGSCRETTQHATIRRLPPDALDAYARRLIAAPEPAARPDLLVLLGDQVYADVTSPTVKRLLKRRRRRPRNAPADQVVSFDEYTKLYLESWRDPEIRWLLSTVPSVMIFDDHEVIDDWNISASWRADMRGLDWWAERIGSGLASYWVYQHLGNLSPDEIAEDPLYAKVVAAEDATDVLREFGERVDREADEAHDAERWRAVQYQWSYSLDLGRTRLVMLDVRCSRVLEPGVRAMLAPGEWSWFLDRARGVYDHLVVGSSLPWLLPPSMHHVESWNERLANSRWPWVAGLAEQMRRAWDLEHWAAFRLSFDALGAALRPHRQRRGGRDRGPGRRRARVRAAGLDQRALRGRAPLVRGPGPVRRPWGANAGAPTHLLADPQPGAGRDAPADKAMLEPRAGLGRPGSRALRRSAPAHRALEEAGRAVLRQRGRHPGTPGPGRRGRDRGHHQRRTPARGGPAATRHGGLSRAITLFAWTSACGDAARRGNTS